MMPLHRIVVAAIATIGLASPLSAQARDSLARPVVPGETVRLHERRMLLTEGTLMRRDSTGLFVVDRHSRDTVQIPIFQITHAEVQRGRHRRGVKAVAKGAAIGAAVGGTFLVLAAASPAKERGLGVWIAGIFTGVTTAVGAGIGTILSFAPDETWVSFDPATVPGQGAGSR